MFEAASRRQFDVLLFWSLDRLSREGVLPTLTYLQRLTNYGFQWRSFTEQYIDSCGIFADAVISTMAVIAKQENVRRSERTPAGLECVKRAGKTLARPRRLNGEHTADCPTARRGAFPESDRTIPEYFPALGPTIDGTQSLRCILNVEIPFP
jgi:DNA invertase Pin-like site-specific DNA recombinase